PPRSHMAPRRGAPGAQAPRACAPGVHRRPELLDLLRPLVLESNSHRVTVAAAGSPSTRARHQADDWRSDSRYGVWPVGTGLRDRPAGAAAGIGFINT